MDKNEQNAPFWEHVAELRQTFVQCFLIILVALGLCLFFYQNLVSILTAPLQFRQHSLIHQEFKRERISNSGPQTQIYQIPSPDTALVLQKSPGVETISSSRYAIPSRGYIDIEILNSKKLVLLSPIDGLAATLKICFCVALVVSSPGWIFLLLKFVSPALEQQELKLVLPFLCFSVMALALGIGFAYYMTIPLAIQYLEGFSENIATNLWTLSNYVDFSLFLMLSNGLAFELSLILFFLVHISLITTEQMVSKRSYIIVFAFILGALLTPPDIITQLLLAIPLIALYELAICYARIRKKFSAAYVHE